MDEKGEKVGDIPGMAVLLVALASTAGQIFLALLSLAALRSVAPGLAGTLTKSLVDGAVAALAGGAAAYLVLMLEGGIAPLTTLMAVFLQGLVAGIIGLIAAAWSLYYIENEEFGIAASAVKRLLSRRGADVLAPSAEEPIQQP